MIAEFRGPTRWLSNFAPCVIILEGRKYKSVEHAYMSAKSDMESWKVFCQFTEKPGEVKKASKTVELRSHWEDIKIHVMKECINQKFNQEPYKSALLLTKDETLQEGNNWGDKFWGVDLKTGEGNNYLGKIIMSKRAELRLSEGFI